MADDNAGRWVDVGDVEARWVGSGFPEDAAVVARLISDAEGVVRWEYPDIDGRVVGEEPPEELPDDPLPLERLVMVVCRMVIRHLRNPEGVRQTTETEGPFSRNRTFAGPQPGDMELTDKERRMLGYLPGAPSPRAFTVPQPEPETAFLGGGHRDAFDVG